MREDRFWEQFQPYQWVDNLVGEEQSFFQGYRAQWELF